MLEGFPGLLTYISLKLIGYTAWSYVGLRWFECGIIQLSMPSGSGGTTLVTAGSQRGRLWRVVGILVSYLADLPFLISECGFPHGRIFC